MKVFAIVEWEGDVENGGECVKSVHRDLEEAQRTLTALDKTCDIDNYIAQSEVRWEPL